MTVDLSDILEDTLSRSWPRSQGREPLLWVMNCIEESTYDWDEGAGEDWARVFVGRETVALLWMKGPIVILTPGAGDISTALRSRGLNVVVVAELDADCLTADRSIVERFAGGPISNHFESRKFSGNDLVWATT